MDPFTRTPPVEALFDYLENNYSPGDYFFIGTKLKHIDHAFTPITFTFSRIPQSYIEAHFDYIVSEGLFITDVFGQRNELSTDSPLFSLVTYPLVLSTIRVYETLLDIV